jgi:hypothetical protein
MSDIEEVVVETGYWCRSCEFFEPEDFEFGRCQSCGCEVSAHTAVKLVIA